MSYIVTIYIFVFIFGLLIGSFLNALIWRLHAEVPIIPSKKNQDWKRSVCPNCRKVIAWYDNIPLLSFILLRGKCRHCEKPISWQYPVVELVTGILFVLAFYHEVGIMNYELGIWAGSIILNSKFLIQIIRDWFLIAVMVIIFVYDLRWYFILDIITLPAIIIIVILNLFLGFSWQDLLISGIMGGGFFLIQFLISQGRWIGGGDIRLGLLMGVALGWPEILLALFIAYLLGSFVGVGLILFGKRKWGSQVPFGAFLTPATILSLFWGGEMLHWYLNLFY